MCLLRQLPSLTLCGCACLDCSLMEKREESGERGHGFLLENRMYRSAPTQRKATFAHNPKNKSNFDVCVETGIHQSGFHEGYINPREQTHPFRKPTPGAPLMNEIREHMYMEIADKPLHPASLYAQHLYFFLKRHQLFWYKRSGTFKVIGSVVCYCEQSQCLGGSLSNAGEPVSARIVIIYVPSICWITGTEIHDLCCCRTDRDTALGYQTDVRSQYRREIEVSAFCQHEYKLIYKRT